MGVQNAKNLVGGAGDTNIADSYQNTKPSDQRSPILVVQQVVSWVPYPFGFLPGVATGAILGASYGAYIDSNETMARSNCKIAAQQWLCLAIKS